MTHKMLTAPIKDKKGLFAMPILVIVFGLLVLLILVIIFKDRLVSLVESIAGFFKGPKLWISIAIVFIVIFRKFVLEVLMLLLKVVRGIFKI